MQGHLAAGAVLSVWLRMQRPVENRWLARCTRCSILGVVAGYLLARAHQMFDGLHQLMPFQTLRVAPSTDFTVRLIRR